MNLLKNIMSTEEQVKQRAHHKYLWSERATYGPIILEKQPEITSSEHLDICQ